MWQGSGLSKANRAAPVLSRGLIEPPEQRPILVGWFVRTVLIPEFGEEIGDRSRIIPVAVPTSGANLRLAKKKQLDLSRRCGKVEASKKYSPAPMNSESSRNAKPESETGANTDPQAVTRRRFIKKTSGTAIGAILALNAFRNEARAEDSTSYAVRITTFPPGAEEISPGTIVLRWVENQTQIGDTEYYIETRVQANNGTRFLSPYEHPEGWIIPVVCYWNFKKMGDFGGWLPIRGEQWAGAIKVHSDGTALFFRDVVEPAAPPRNIVISDPPGTEIGTLTCDAEWVIGRGMQKVKATFSGGWETAEVDYMFEFEAV